MRNNLAIIIIVFSILLLVSCSAKGVSSPEIEDNSIPISGSNLSDSQSSANLLGCYNISINPETKEANVEVGRQSDFAVNLVSIFNQFPASLQIRVISHQSGSFGNIYYLDVTIKHPHPTNTLLNVYDVRGILMGNGSGTLAYNGDLHYPVLSTDQSIDGVDGASVDKPDGYTRWFNKPEFSTGGNPVFSYVKGNLADPKYSPTATLCPYHYYADGLSATGNVCDWLASNSSKKGVFSAGHSNTRRFAVRFPTHQTNLQFGYAIVGSWEGADPSKHPANANEAIAAKATVGNGLFYESPSHNGGNLIMDFTLYGWKSLPTSIIVESTVLSSNHTLTPTEMIPTGTGANYASFHVEIPADHVTSLTGNEAWIIAEFANSNYKNPFGTTNLAGDDPLASFFRFDVPVRESLECGKFDWVSTADGQMIERGRAMTTLSDDSVVVVGQFSQEFCPNDDYNTPAVFGDGEATETTLIDPHLGDIFIARYNPDGTLAWAKRAGGYGNDIASGITTCSDDSIVVTGAYGGNCYGALYTGTFGPGEPGQVILPASNNYGSFFIAKYNSNGTLAWAKRAVGEYYYNNEFTSGGSDVESLSDNSLIVTGTFANKATFGDGEPNETTLTYHPYYWDMFIAKYNANGTLAWAKRQGGTELERPYEMTVRPDNSFVLEGGFGTQDHKPAIFGEGEANQTILYTAGQEDIFIASYNPDGTLQWARRAGSIMPDSGQGVTCLSDYSVVMCGSYGNGGDPNEAPATFGQGQPNETILQHSGWDDIFIARYDPDGVLMWAKRGAGVSQEIAHDITTLSGDMFAITGEFWEPCTFDEGLPTEITITPYPDTDPYYSYSDIFVTWFNPDGSAYCANTAGGVSYDCSYAITSLSDDSVVASGDTEGDYGGVFGKGQVNETWVYGQSYVLFVAKWNK